jgi:hypothetical protein
MQRTWSIGEIGRIAQTLVAVGPTPDFAAGVLALAHALNAPVQLPERRESAVVVVIDDGGRELAR